MKVRLPNPLNLTCPQCGLELTAAPALVEELPELLCPRCQTRHAAYFWLGFAQRREISALLRGQIYFAAHKHNVNPGQD